MFETLDTMISLGVIFLILSMVNKYLISFVKRIFKIKVKVIAKEMETFIGEKTSKYLIPYLEEKAKHLNFLDEKKRLRQLNKEQLKIVVGELETFMKSENAEGFKKVFGIDISVDDIKKEIQGELDEIKAHLNNLKDKVENVYDNTMEKISEVYEQNIRYWNLGFGILLAFFVNADLFGIYNSLSRSPAMRQGIFAQTENIESEMKELSEKIKKNAGENVKDIQTELDEANATVTSLLGEVESTGIVLGWTNEKISKACSNFNSIVYKLIGLLIAGLLISFGAPFWHDFIGTFMGLRKTLTGKKGGMKEDHLHQHLTIKQRRGKNFELFFTIVVISICCGKHIIYINRRGCSPNSLLILHQAFINGSFARLPSVGNVIELT